MLQRASQRLAASRERAALVACRITALTYNEQLSCIRATSSPGGSVGTAVGKSAAAAARRVAGVARHLSSEAAGFAAAPPNVDSLQTRLKDVLGEKLAFGVDLAAVLSDPLMAKSAVILLHRVRIQCGALLRLPWCFCN